MGVAVMGQEHDIRPFGEGDGSMVKGSACKGFAPGHPACPLDIGGVAIGFEEETNGGVGGQELSTGEANTVVTEVNGPGVIFAYSGDLIMGGDFGKAESVAAGNADGLTAVGRFGKVLIGLASSARQQLVMEAGCMMAGKTIAGNMLSHGQKESFLNQQAGPTIRAGVRTGAPVDMDRSQCCCLVLWWRDIFGHEVLLQEKSH